VGRRTNVPQFKLIELDRFWPEALIRINRTSSQRLRFEELLAIKGSGGERLDGKTYREMLTALWR
jgi:hypothetical protein